MFHQSFGPDHDRQVLLLHGWGCDHAFMTEQAQRLATSHRVVALDLWGHGRTPLPPGGGHLSDLADAVAATCDYLSLSSMVVVGHSMGGAVGLELAVRYPELVSRIVALDGTWLPAPELVVAAAAMYDELASGWDEPKPALFSATEWFFLPGEEQVRERFEASLRGTDREALRWALKAHVIEYEATDSLRRCRRPIGYVSSERATGDLARVREASPGLKVEQLTGAGHFAPLTAPATVSAAIARLLAGFGA